MVTQSRFRLIKEIQEKYPYKKGRKVYVVFRNLEMMITDEKYFVKFGA